MGLPLFSVHPQRARTLHCELNWHHGRLYRWLALWLRGQRVYVHKSRIHCSRPKTNGTQLRRWRAERFAALSENTEVEVIIEFLPPVICFPLFFDVLSSVANELKRHVVNTFRLTSNAISSGIINGRAKRRSIDFSNKIHTNINNSEGLNAQRLHLWLKISLWGRLN